MSVWTSIGGAICVAVTALGLVLTWQIWRKNGASRGTRALAWSLLPLAAYLTGAVALLGRLVLAIVHFADGFVFSPKSWAGVIVVAVSAVLFLTSGGLPLVGWRKRRARRKLERDTNRKGKADGGPPAVTTASRRTPVPGASDDDLGDVQEILRRRGIK